MSGVNVECSAVGPRQADSKAVEDAARLARTLARCLRRLVMTA